MYIRKEFQWLLSLSPLLYPAHPQQFPSSLSVSSSHSCVLGFVLGHIEFNRGLLYDHGFLTLLWRLMSQSKYMTEDNDHPPLPNPLVFKNWWGWGTATWASPRSMTEWWQTVLCGLNASNHCCDGTTIAMVVMPGTVGNRIPHTFPAIFGLLHSLC